MRQARLRLGSRVVAAVLMPTALAVGLSGPAAAGTRLTEREFRKEANAVCRVAYDAVAQVFEDALGGVGSGGTLPPATIAAAANGAVLIFRHALDRIEALDGPAAYERKVDRMLDQYRAVADRIEADPKLIFAERGIFGKPDKLAARLGLRGCVQEPSRSRR